MIADNVDLHQVLAPEVLTPLLENPETLERLKPFLPPPHDAEAIRALIKSPQFFQVRDCTSPARRVEMHSFDSVEYKEYKGSPSPASHRKRCGE